ncbi:unnamed protein product [Strongylus vulgaris]|uniref:Uncharacterized protein n=1 Tax=Strongylus vulgaris TaxID=40348 RepID=A0A3P7K046_STRVU|nr:unnamed protein product [Strongylus vulgaris]
MASLVNDILARHDEANYPCGNFSDTYQKLSESKGSIGLAFAVFTRTGGLDQRAYFALSQPEGLHHDLADVIPR